MNTQGATQCYDTAIIASRTTAAQDKPRTNGILIAVCNSNLK